MADLPPQVQVVSIKGVSHFSKFFVNNVDVIHLGRMTDFPYSLPMNRKIVMTHWTFPHLTKTAGLFYKSVRNVSVTEYGRLYLLEKHGVDSDVLYCPADVDTYKNLSEPSGKTVFTIGNLFAHRPEMGWNRLEEVMRKVIKKDSEVHFGIIGLNDSLIIPEDLKSNVYKVGFVHMKNMPEVLQRATCLVYSTTFNLIPHSLIGGMACQRPVVAFELNSTPELVHNGINGFLAPCYDTEVFARRILELINDPSKAKRMGIEARKTIMEKCHYMKIASRIY